MNTSQRRCAQTNCFGWWTDRNKHTVGWENADTVIDQTGTPVTLSLLLESRVINLPSLPGTGLALAGSFSQKTLQAQGKHRGWWSCDPLAACVCSLCPRGWWMESIQRALLSGFQLDVASGKQLHEISERRERGWSLWHLRPLNHHTSQHLSYYQGSLSITGSHQTLVTTSSSHHLCLEEAIVSQVSRFQKYCVISCLFLKFILWLCGFCRSYSIQKFMFWAEDPPTCFQEGRALCFGTSLEHMGWRRGSSQRQKRCHFQGKGKVLNNRPQSSRVKSRPMLLSHWWSGTGIELMFLVNEEIRRKVRWNI